MTIHKEGYTSIALCILFIFVLNALIQFYLPQAHTLKWVIYILSFVLFVAVMLFFRSPVVRTPFNEKAVLSPVDGTVLEIKQIEETEFLKRTCMVVSVAISPLNVHVNRSPVKGVVKYRRDTTIAVENSIGVTILYKQLAGALAVLNTIDIKEGDSVEQGAQCGFSVSASRVDVFLPIGTTLNVNTGDMVKGGQTILAQLSAYPITG